MTQQTKVTDLVTVEDTDLGWIATCRECRQDVALKQTEDDAHLAAARHLARVHIPVPVLTGSRAWNEWDD